MNLSHKNMNFFPGVYREKSRSRNWVRADVNTKDGGLQGGFTVDTATVDLVAHPIDTITNTADALEKGYEDAKKTTGMLYDEAGVAIEKSGNLLTGDGFKTDEEVEKEKLAVNPDVNNIIGDETAKKELLRVKVGDKELELEKDKNIEGINTNQSDLDKYITLKYDPDATDIEKKSCNLTAIIDMIKSQAIADGITDLKNIDNNTIYDLAKAQGDDIISGKFSVADPSKLAKLIDPRLDYKFVDAGPVTSENIIDQLDNNKIVKVTLSDGHRQKITGYEVVGKEPDTSLRFKIEDPGYQHDTYINPETMQPYKINKQDKEVVSREHGTGPKRKISSILVIE